MLSGVGSAFLDASEGCVITPEEGVGGEKKKSEIEINRVERFCWLIRLLKCWAQQTVMDVAYSYSLPESSLFLSHT